MFSSSSIEVYQISDVEDVQVDTNVLEEIQGKHEILISGINTSSEEDDDDDSDDDSDDDDDDNEIKIDLLNWNLWIKTLIFSKIKIKTLFLLRIFHLLLYFFLIVLCYSTLLSAAV